MVFLSVASLLNTIHNITYIQRDHVWSIDKNTIVLQTFFETTTQVEKKILPVYGSKYRIYTTE